MTAVKICGLKDPENLSAATSAGARYVGFVFYPPSPRNIAADSAKELSLTLPTGVKAIGLFVNPTNEQLEHILGIVPLDMLQLHGSESPERVQQIKDKFAMPVMKATKIREPADLETVPAYEETADWLLFDSRPEAATLPGGTGHSFDWSLLAGKTFSRPWMLSGGLTPENVAEALSQLSPTAVDVSSGVESAPGVKDPAKIKAFIDAVKSAI
ncbi:MAG TPA: phosphoribosylanthranilate isomerase [Alphaproteobacteria bacterium]|nr:phosphoribosylanthranilate isomerase [Alphaproteobacteria bacterium]USO05303.1 MAG: phosphoribosylanthranilate isomerase [Rhodospirillales bacterium]HOO81212.1 phosphoribosylanthranilate isomerase [Alphaproteobacteria bacterium]